MTTLKTLVIQFQRNNGVINAKGMAAPPTSDSVSSIMNPTAPQSSSLSGSGVTFDANSQNITDGYWIVLQDWSQCNLKCGGGTSTLQRMCVPPKTGGAPCQGEPIITRPCNTQPCPQVTNTTAPNSTANNIVLPPTVRVMPFSSRPQRYSV